MDLDLILQKNNTDLEHLLKAILEDSDSDETWSAGFVLSDHYKDEKIEQILLKALKSDKIEKYNFNLIMYLYTEVFTNEDSLEFVINMLLNGERNLLIRLDSQAIIFDSKFPYKRKTINRLLRFLNKKKTENDLTEWQKDWIETLIGYYEDQKVMLRVYSNFDKRLKALFKDV